MKYTLIEVTLVKIQEKNAFSVLKPFKSVCIVYTFIYKWNTKIIDQK